MKDLKKKNNIESQESEYSYNRMTSKPKDIFFEDEELVEKKNLRKKRKVALIVLAVLIIGSLIVELGYKLTDKDSVNIHIEIRCDKVVENLSALKDPTLIGYMPQSGIALKKLKYIGKKDNTALEVIEKVCKSNSIEIVTTSNGVSKIGYLTNGDCGKDSLWKFTVNGKVFEGEPEEYVIQPGDDIIWTFSLENGRDLKGDK